MMRFVVIAWMFVFTACSPDRPEHLTGSLSAKDLSLVIEIVRKDLAGRERSTAGRIKSVAETNGTVEVWFEEKQARWGEAGYILEKATNGWKITSELFR